MSLNVMGPGTMASMQAPHPLQPSFAPALQAKARSSDPLPTFPNAETYKNYVVKLVSQTRAAEQELGAARKALNEAKGTQGAVDMAQERVDGLKLQLAVLRDNYPIPAEWTRSRWMGGQGFDLPSFWREQVEGLPGKPVVVAPAPAPVSAPAKPVPPPVKIPAPAPTPTPAPAPAAVAPSSDAFRGKLGLAKMAAESSSASSARDEAVAASLRGALKAATSPADCGAVVESAHDYMTYPSNREQLQMEAANRATQLSNDPVALSRLGGTLAANDSSTSNRDNALTVVLSKAIASAQDVEGLNLAVKQAHEDAVYPSSREAIHKLAATRGASLLQSSADLVSLANTIAANSSTTSGRDEAVAIALGKAVDNAKTINDLQLVMQACKTDYVYPSNRDAMLQRAAAKGASLG